MFKNKNLFLIVCGLFLLPTLLDSNQFNAVDAKTSGDSCTEEKQSLNYNNKTFEQNATYDIVSDKNDVLNNILSNETFFIQGTINTNDGAIPINQYYNFSSKNKFDIAEWLNTIGFFNDNDLYQIYYSLIETRNFENVDCLECYRERFSNLSSNNAECNNKRENNPFVIQTRNNYIYESSHFIIEYDTSITYNRMFTFSTNMEAVYSFFSSLNFENPIPEQGYFKLRIQLSNTSGGTGIAADAFYNLINAFSNKGRSYIVFYNFNNVFSSYSTENDAQAYLQRVGAHEYFHTIQNAYNASSTWFKESFADCVVLCAYGLNWWNWNSNIKNFVESDLPLNANSTKYGACMFPLTLFKEYGGFTNNSGFEIIKEFYEEYETYSYSSAGNVIVSIVNTILSNRNLLDTFHDVFRKMSGYLYNPSYFFSNFASSNYWGNNKTTINMTFNHKIDLNVTINPWCREYYKISLPEGFISQVELEVSFSSTAFLLPIETKIVGGNEQVSLKTPISNGMLQTYTFGDDCSEIGFVLYSPTYSGNPDNALINVKRQVNALMDNYTRYFEHRFYILEEESHETIINRSVSGFVIIQTFGSEDTYLTIKNYDGSNPLSNDNYGYGQNAFLKKYLYANTNYRISLRLYDYDDYGYTKLAIIPSDSYNASYSSGISSYTDIYSFNIANGNVRYITNQQNEVRMVKFTPPTSMDYYISTGGDEDTYLYIIDPASSNLLIEDVDYTDEEGEDGDGNAGLIIHLNSGKAYLIIVSLYLIPDTGSFTLCIYPSTF